MDRKTRIGKAAQSEFDVAVIGGGITGAGIFLKCCAKGWKTILLERADFAGGTSSRSAKMIHGGLRYLQYMQVKLVREALEEREHLLDQYPHLVRPLPFLLPVYGSQVERVKLKVGLAGYDALSGHSQLPKHRSLSSGEVAARYPMLRTDGLKGAFYYFDAITSDARLTNEVIMQGCQLGGTAFNYMDVDISQAAENGECRFQATDMLGGATVQITADRLVSATGIWTDEFLDTDSAKRIMKPSKGVHIVVDGKRFPEKDVLLIPCTDDRFIWACPWENGLVIIGATDTLYEGSLREPGTTREDVNYLLENTNNYLKGFQLDESDILSVYSGLRPLLNDSGASDTVKMSRDYRIWWERDRLLVIAGGKLTSFLSMAEHVVGELVRRAPAPAGTPDVETTSSVDLIDAIRGKAAQDESLPGGAGITTADVRFYIRHQHAERIDDILSRRCSASYGMQQFDSELVEAVADIMGSELNWTEQQRKDEIAEYRASWDILHTWTK